jgi:hypothetical protein
MTKAKTKRRWVFVDAPVERLLDEIGAPELEYYSVAEERAVNEALDAWPLLAAVARALQADKTREEPTMDADQLLRVVVDRTSESGNPDEPASSHQEEER